MGAVLTWTSQPAGLGSGSKVPFERTRDIFGQFLNKRLQQMHAGKYSVTSPHIWNGKCGTVGRWNRGQKDRRMGGQRDGGTDRWRTHASFLLVLRNIVMLLYWKGRDQRHAALICSLISSTWFFFGSNSSSGLNPKVPQPHKGDSTQNHGS